MNAFDTTRKTAVEIQRAYYARTSHRYNEMHAHEDDAHGFALRFMISVVEHLGIQSILDIGCGTGRALLKIKKEMPIKAEPDLFLIKVPSPSNFGSGGMGGASNWCRSINYRRKYSVSAHNRGTKRSFSICHHWWNSNSHNS